MHECLVILTFLLAACPSEMHSLLLSVVDSVPKMCNSFRFQTSCHETRKRKETELEMLTGTIEGWEEEVISHWRANYNNRRTAQRKLCVLFSLYSNSLVYCSAKCIDIGGTVYILIWYKIYPIVIAKSMAEVIIIIIITWLCTLNYLEYTVNISIWIKNIQFTDTHK